MTKTINPNIFSLVMLASLPKEKSQSAGSFEPVTLTPEELRFRRLLAAEAHYKARISGGVSRRTEPNYDPHDISNRHWRDLFKLDTYPHKSSNQIGNFLSRNNLKHSPIITFGFLRTDCTVKAFRLYLLLLQSPQSQDMLSQIEHLRLLEQKHMSLCVCTRCTLAHL